MSEFFDYRPDTGITEYFEYEEDTGIARIHSVQDVEPLLRQCAEIRAHEVARRKLKADDYMVLHAQIPAVVIMELRNKGIDIFDQNDGPRLMKELETTYKHLKCSPFKHDR